MGRLSNLRVADPVLTQLTRGYTNAESIFQSLFPVVYVEKEAGTIPGFGKEAFKLYNTERALRGKSNRINPEDMTPVSFVCKEHDLEYPIDYREDAEAALPLQKYAARTVKDGVKLQLENIVSTLLQDTATFSANNRLALATTTCWSAPSTSTPLADIRAGRNAVRAAIGKRPNLCAFGAAAFEAISEHPAVLDRIKYTQTGVVTAELLSALIGMKVVVGEAIKSSDANVFSDIWGDNVIMAYVPSVASQEERNEYEPSFGYTLVKRNSDLVDLRTEDGKLEIVRYTEIAVPKLLGADAGFLISNVVA